LKKVGHTNNQKGIEKANNSSKENARKEAAAAAANEIQIHSSWFTHTLQTHHIQFCISIFNTLPVC
jgi:hypothetical protein